MLVEFPNLQPCRVPNQPPQETRMSHYDFTGVAEWNRIPGWFDLGKAIAIQQRVKQLPPGAQLVELGSFQGRSSIAIAAVLPPQATLHCVDHFRGSEEHHRMDLDVSQLFESFSRNIQRFGVAERIHVIRDSTLAAATQFAPSSCNLILVDAAHDFDSVHADLTAWYPKLRPGGLLFCDDYDPRWPGVMRAVESLGLQGSLAAPALWLHQKPDTETAS